MATDPAIDRLFLVDSTGTLRILDVHTLRQLGSLRAGSGAAQIAVDTRNNRVFVLDTAGGRVTTIDGKRGTVVGVASTMGGATGIQVDERTGRVFVESAGTTGLALQQAGPGSVTMLDADSGKALRTIQVGPLPFGAALDATHHRLFVSSFDITADSGDITADSGLGRVQVIDTAHDTLLRTILVATGPFSLTEDPQREHLAVAGLSADALPSSGWTDAVGGARHVLGAAGPTPTPQTVQGGRDGQGAVSVVAAEN
jgi:DNA-binding beta-propeller fold protein YncE